MDAFNVAFYIALAAAAAAARQFKRDWYRYLKPWPVFYLALLVFSENLAAVDAHPTKLWVGAALLFGLAGDLFLLRERMFAYGLLAFLLGHLCYGRAFEWQIFSQPVWGVAAAYGAGLFFAFELGAHAAQRRASLGPAVIVYFAVILAMILSALGFYGLGLPGGLAIACGALLFGASDAMLGIEKFITAWRGSSALIAGTYFAAQFLIAWGTLRLPG